MTAAGYKNPNGSAGVALFFLANKKMDMGCLSGRLNDMTDRRTLNDVKS